jgi:hypothetical protein
LYGAETWTLGTQIRNTWELLKCGVEEGWRRSVAPNVCEMKKYCIESRRRGISYIKRRLTGLVTSCIGIAF